MSRQTSGLSLCRLRCSSASPGITLDCEFLAQASWRLLRNRRGTQLVDGTGADQAKHMLDEVVLKMDVQVLASWPDPAANTLSMCIRKTAAKFARGDRLATWARYENTFVAAVPTRSLVQRFNSEADANIDSLGPCLTVTPTTSYGRVWAWRWRHAFGARHMKLPSGSCTI